MIEEPSTQQLPGSTPVTPPQINPGRDTDVRRGRIMGGVVLVVLGILFLLHNIYPWFRFEDYWPVILIAIGVVLMLRSRR